MKTIIDIPEENAVALDILRAKKRISRNALINQAISEFLAKAETENSASAQYDSIESLWGMTAENHDAFDGLDGLAYTQKMRSEWERGSEDDISHYSTLHDSVQSEFEHKRKLKPLKPHPKK